MSFLVLHGPVGWAVIGGVISFAVWLDPFRGPIRQTTAQIMFVCLIGGPIMWLFAIYHLLGLIGKRS